MKRFFAPIIIGVSQAYTKLFPNALKKRTWWPIFFVGVILIAVVSVTPAHAFLEDLGLWLSRAIASLLLELAKLCIFLAIFFLRYFITLASYNNYIDVSVVKLGWVMVRDVANMFFIVGLLVIAFATILGLEHFEWKKGVVKIVLMAILINFSNLIAQLIIDVAHIFTITFLNAVSATAGGNLITLFQLDKILKLAQGGPSGLGDTLQSAGLSIFAGSALAFVFALLAALTIGAYLLVMMARIVVLWALIILSPLAFMMYALPHGEEYAHEWWKEFSKHVIVAPIMVFFLWLAFATFGTGQIISEIQSDPNVIKVNASGEEQSVSILEISTWENLASFLLGIAFLWVGIKKTEETGATGAGVVGHAIDFTKNVATIATGYAAGRWLVGGAVGKVKEHGSGLLHAAGENLSLGGSKILDKAPFGIGKAIRAPGRYFRDSAARRHDALHHREELEDLKQKEAIGKFREHPTGLTGLLAMSHKVLAEQQARTALAERGAKAVASKHESEEKKALFNAEPDRYEHLIKEEEEAHKLEGALKQQEQGVTITVGRELFRHEKHEFEEKFDNLMSKAGFTPEEIKEFKSIKSMEDGEDKKNKKEEFDRKLKDVGKSLGIAKQREFEKEAAKDLPHIQERLLEVENKEREQAQKGHEDKFFGEIDLGHVSAERDGLIAAINKATDEQIRGRAIENSVFKGILSKDGQMVSLLEALNQVEKSTKTDDEKNKEKAEINEKIEKRKEDIRKDKKDAIKQGAAELRKKYFLDENYNFLPIADDPNLSNKDRKEMEEAQRENFEEFLDTGDLREEAAASLSEQQRAQIMEKVVTDNSQWLKVGAFYATEGAKQKTKKAEGEMATLSLRVSDILRGVQGKIMDQVRNEERTKISEEMKEMREWSFPEFDEEFRKNFTLTRSLLLKKQKQGGKLSDAEEEALKNARQRQARIVASGEDRKWHHSMVSALKEMDTSYVGLDDDTKHAGELLLGMLSGKSFDQINDEEKFAKEQEEYRKGLKEKAGILMRTVQKGIQESAETHGNIHLTGLVREGRDERGSKVVGIATGMKKGVGRGKILGTGTKETGLEVSEGEVVAYGKPSRNITSAADHRAYTASYVEDGKVKTKMKKESKGLIAGYVNTRAEGFKKEGGLKLRGLLGAAGWNESLWDKDKKDKFGDVPVDFQEEWQPVFNEWSTVLASKAQSSEKNSIIRAWRELYSEWGVDPKEAATMPIDRLRSIAKLSGLMTHDAPDSSAASSDTTPPGGSTNSRAKARFKQRPSRP